MQIHYQLATLKKENSSITDYSHQFTSFANTLATIDQPLNDFGVFGFLLAGLKSNTWRSTLSERFSLLCLLVHDSFVQ